MLSLEEYRQLSFPEKKKYYRSQSNVNVIKMYTEGYIGEYTATTVLKERNALPEEWATDLHERNLKMSRLMGQVAANVR